MNKLTAALLIATTSALVSTNILWFQAYRTERKISDLAVGIDLSQADRQAVLPEIVRRIHESEDPEVSIAYLNFAFDLEASVNRETETSEKPEQIAAQLELLEQQLSDREFGKIELLLSYSANLYTPGAIQTTYDILMRSNGHHADLNRDGRIDSTELDRLPCQTLIDIEELWRKHTNERCGWVEPDSSSFSPQCDGLQLVSTYEMIDPQTRQDITKTATDNLTLLATIFNPMDFDWLEPKIEACLAKM